MVYFEEGKGFYKREGEFSGRPVLEKGQMEAEYLENHSPAAQTRGVKDLHPSVSLGPV